MNDQKTRQTWLRKYGPTAVFLLGLFSFRWSIADQYVVPSGSMIPALHIGDRILVNKLA